MKITDLHKQTRVDEAPLGDYELVGNWGDKEKSHGFRHAPDRKMLQNPSAVRITRNKFGNTEHTLNFYFVNLPEATKHSEHGFMSPEEAATAMPKAWPEIAQRASEANHAEAINVIFVGNTGANRMNMTPWIMAHRIGHAIQSSYRGQQGWNSWKHFEDDSADFFSTLLSQVYNVETSKRYFWTPGMMNGGGLDALELSKFLEGIGGMRSARKGNLGGRPYEFMYEMFAQFVVTGQLSFRDCPQMFGRRNHRAYRIQDEETADMWNRDLNSHIADHLGSIIDNCLYDATGKFLVM